MSQSGFGLLENLLTLAVITSLLLGSYLWLRQYQAESRLQQFQSHFAELQMATAAYFFGQCRQQAFNQAAVSVNQLLEKGVITHRGFVANPFGQDFQISLSQSDGTTPAYADFTAEFDRVSPAQRANLRNRLGADGEGVSLHWRLPLSQIIRTTRALAPHWQRGLFPIDMTRSAESPLWMSRASLLGYREANSFTQASTDLRCAI